MATFSETCALTSRKYRSEPGIISKKLSGKRKFFWSHSSDFDLNFHSFSCLQDPLATIFNASCSPTSRNM